MARGMDVDGVGLVVNYDCPSFARTYVHRVGRTARGGREGAAVTLCRAEEVRHFRATLRKIEGAQAAQLTLQREAVAGAKKKYAAALLALRDVLNEERQSASGQGQGQGQGHGQGQAATQPLGKARLAALRARWAALDAPTARVTTEQIEAAAQHRQAAASAGGNEDDDDVNDEDEDEDEDVEDDEGKDEVEDDEDDEDEEEIDALSESLLTTTDAADEEDEEEDEEEDDDVSGSDDSDE